MLMTGGALFAGEMWLSQEKYFTDMRTYERATADHIVENDTAFAAFGVVIHWGMEIVGVFVGLALVVLAMVAYFGRGWARAVSWLFGLPILLWYGLQASLGALSVVFAGGGPHGTDPPELARRFDQAWPPWLNTLDTVLMVAVAVLLMAALVFQTVPAADRFFRSSASR
jgi:hypothetical protein